MADAAKPISVEVLTSDVVVPAEPTPRRGLWVSNLDLSARRGYTPVVYFYRATDEQGQLLAADVLRASLARALVPFYPFAGRLGYDADGRVQIDCNGEGALFVTARADCTMDELIAEFTPSTEMRDLFIPPAKSADPPCLLLLIQVTYLRCGGAVLGTAMHHTVLDARGASHFVETWASIARGDDAPMPPFLERTPLRARSPPVVSFDHLEYKPDPTPIDPVKSATYDSAIIPVTKSQVDAIKARCTAGHAGVPHPSTFTAVTALVWRCVCRARALPSSSETRLFTMIDMRSRMVPPLPPGFFGNAVIRTSVSAGVDEIAAGPMGPAARRVRAATSHGDEFTRSLIDYLETVDTANVPRSGISRAHLRAISWLGMSFDRFDLGWGAPVFMGPALMYYSGFVYVMNGPEKDRGGASVVISLEPECMPEFRKIFDEELARLQD